MLQIGMSRSSLNWQRVGEQVVGRRRTAPARCRGGRGCSSARSPARRACSRRPDVACREQIGPRSVVAVVQPGSASPIAAAVCRTASPSSSAIRSASQAGRHRPSPCRRSPRPGRRCWRARSRAPAGRRRRRGSRSRPRPAARRPRGRRRTTGTATGRGVPGADRDQVAEVPAQLHGPGTRPRSRRRSRSVRYSSPARASSRSARLAASPSPGVRAARARRTRRPRGALRTATPRPPRPGRSAGSVATSPPAAAWWASTLASPPTASSASIIAACSAGSAPGGTASSTAERAISCRNATPWPRRSSSPVAPSASDRRPRHGQRREHAPRSPRPARRTAAPTRAGPMGRARRSGRARRRARSSGSGESGWARIWLTKNGLPAVRRVDVGGIEAVLTDQLGDGRTAQRGELDPPGARRGHEIAQHGPQRVGGPQVLAVGQHQQQRERVDPAAQEPHQVERGLVGPVQILDDEDVGTFAQGRQHGREDLVLRRRVPQYGRHRRPEIGRDVAERDRAGAACSASRTPPTTRAPERGRRTPAATWSSLDRPHRPRARPTRRRRPPGGRGRRAPPAGGRAPAASSTESRAARWPQTGR